MKSTISNTLDVVSYLKSQALLIDETLDAKMPLATTRPAVLHEAMRYSVFSGGKRLRPILCLAVAEALGGEGKRALIPACAIELLHTYTLIHDDLPALDNDDERRGKPSSHKKFGEANAILAGDALLTLTFEWLADYPLLAKELAQATGSEGVIGGQVEDMAAQGASPDEELLRYIHLNKTAKLFQAAAKMGALSAGASKSDVDALGEYAQMFGLAYQIVDDIEDQENDEQLTAVDVYGAAAFSKVQECISAARAALGRVTGEKAVLEALLGLISPLPEKHDR